MKRLFLIMLCLLMLITPSAWAASGRYPDPNRQTIWNNITDGIHTLGQSPAQAKKTKMYLHNTRRLNRQKSINQAKRQAWLNSH